MVSKGLIDKVFTDSDKQFCVEDDTLCIQTVIDGKISICTAAGIDRICFDDFSGIEIIKAGDGKCS